MRKKCTTESALLPQKAQLDVVGRQMSQFGDLPWGIARPRPFMPGRPAAGKAFSCSGATPNILEATAAPLAAIPRGAALCAAQGGADCALPRGRRARQHFRGRPPAPRGDQRAEQPGKRAVHCGPLNAQRIFFKTPTASDCPSGLLQLAPVVSAPLMRCFPPRTRRSFYRRYCPKKSASFWATRLTNSGLS